MGEKQEKEKDEHGVHGGTESTEPEEIFRLAACYGAYYQKGLGT